MRESRDGRGRRPVRGAVLYVLVVIVVGFYHAGSAVSYWRGHRRNGPSSSVKATTKTAHGAPPATDSLLSASSSSKVPTVTADDTGSVAVVGRNRGSTTKHTNTGRFPTQRTASTSTASSVESSPPKPEPVKPDPNPERHKLGPETGKSGGHGESASPPLPSTRNDRPEAPPASPTTADVHTELLRR